MRNNTDTAEEEKELLGSTSPPPPWLARQEETLAAHLHPTSPATMAVQGGRKDADPPRQSSAPRRLSKGLAAVDHQAKSTTDLGGETSNGPPGAAPEPQEGGQP
jgi:hypothetical protein